jgi:hypothetical protein
VNQEDPLTASRLFPIDIGNDAPELRRRHPDQSHYLIMKGVIGVRIQEPADNDPNKAPRFIGSVWQILPNYINVPLPYSGTLAGLMPQAGKPPRYTVTLNFGHNLEPWVSSVVLTPGLPNSAF